MTLRAFASFSLFALCAGSALAQTTLFSQGTFNTGIPAGGPYVPAGTLYDNEQSNGTTSLASQDSSSGASVARSADDFTIAGSACASGLFDITQIRVQMVQVDAAPQGFEVDLYDDIGDGTSPAPTNAITPIANFVQTSSAVFGPFGAGTSIWEATFDTTGLQLSGDTTYWISGYGGNPAANAGGFNNFFAASAGSGVTTDNGMIIAPGAGVAAWTPAEAVLGPPALAFSFAIDGACAVGGGNPPFTPAVPTMSPLGIALLAGALMVLALVVMARRRRNEG